MPLEFEICHADRLVHAAAVGELSADDIQAFLGSVIAAQAMPYAKLFDIRRVTGLANAGRLGEVADTVRLYDKMKLGPIGALAIVTGAIPQRVSYAQAFLSASAAAERPVRVFQETEEARAWLTTLDAAR